MNETTNNYYKIRANYYKDEKRIEKPYDSEMDYYSDNSDHMNVYVYGGLNNSRWMPCVSLEYSGNEYDSNGNTTGGSKFSEGFDCTFKSETTFSEIEGYNGCIAFAWTNKSLGNDAVPEFAYGSNYDIALMDKVSDVKSITGNDTAVPTNGLLGASLAKYNNDEYALKGFSITLYTSNNYNKDDPDDDYEEDGTVPYTTRLNRYMITYTNSNYGVSHIQGELSNYADIPYDVYYNENVISVYHVENKYRFYLNGMYINSIADTDICMDEWDEEEGFFTVSMMASRLNDASIEILKINNNGGNLMINEHISNNNMHLTPEEKDNLGNLGASVLNYYENNDTDDTGAFQRALDDTNFRRVYVPGGTYKITGELVVRDNCELELAQDAVLEFKYPEKSASAVNEEGASTNTETVEDIDPWTEEKIESAYKCITLKMSSSLIGNHATIRVPYEFDGIVIYASTRSHPTDGSLITIEPFNKFDPQWKPARYIKDINIVKPITQNITNSVRESLLGFHASMNKECSGTAVFIEGYRSPENEGSTFIWGLDYSGLRIAGAFKFGIYGTNNYIWVDKITGEPVKEEAIDTTKHKKSGHGLMI